MYMAKRSVKRMMIAGMLTWILALATGVSAEDGVTESTVLIGVEGFTGSFSADEENLGFEVAMKRTNDQGGVHGRKMVLKGYERKGGTPGATANAKRLVEEDRAFCLFNFGGMPLAMALTPYVMEKRVPYLFPHQGSDTLAGKRYIFTSYPFYKGESDMMLKYLSEKRGFKKMAVLYADNAYGYIFRDKLRENSTRLGYQVVSEQSIKEMKPADLQKEIQELKSAGPEAVIMALYVEQAQKAMEAKGKLDWRNVTLVSTGPLTDEEHLNIAGGYGEGTIGLCLYPDPEMSQQPGVVEYRQMMKKYCPDKKLNRYSLYGYVFGKLVVEGLKSAGREITREGFIDAMESIKNWQSGGIIPPVSFSKTDHHAQSAGFIVELKGGKFQSLTDWIETE
jgi:ABC-type branched-subunit amino acid transport system substrate-binding protein